jgi:nudix-type nucleoside diphosphatase (YffH/AdpP family)
MAHELLDVETVYEGWARLMVAKVRLPDGRIAKREVEDHGDAVAVLPYDPVRRVAMLITQFRAPVFYKGESEDLLEAPAGLLEDEEPEPCARREAMEEAGLKLGALEPVATIWPMPGVSTERIHLYLAPYGEADRVGAGGGLAEEHEETTLVEIGLSELGARADAGRIQDSKTLVLLQTLRLRRPDLF